MEFITNFADKYQILIHNVIGIGSLILAWVVITGIVRFSIGMYQKKKGIYPEGH